MPDQPELTASPSYALGQLQRAVARAASSADAADRGRALEKVRRWQDVLTGMTDGRLSVGSRTPVADTPAWVTLEVAHGGFATGRYLAEAPLSDQEEARLAALPAGVPGEAERERLNLWYLGDAGQGELLQALRGGRYRVELPEEAALGVAVLLLDLGYPGQALDLVAELRPLMSRLRFTPRFEPAARPAGAAVRLVPAAEAARSLRAVRTPPQLAAMRRTVGVWNPLYDQLVALWLTTVDGEPPFLDEAGAVRGGWPCRTWPADWAGRRDRWLAACQRAREEHEPAGHYARPRGNFSRLHAALLACPDGSDALSGREVGRVRRALAATVTRHGAPGSEPRTRLRAAQAGSIAAPGYEAVAQVLARRLDGYPADGGLPGLGPVAAPVARKAPLPGIPAGTPVPGHLLAKAARALEAPPQELVRLGVITSGDVLARVLPQLTARIAAAGISDPALAGLYEQAYAAFRRRRSLLLLNLEHQVRFEELPWVTALQPCRSSQPAGAAAARRALEQAAMLALTAFPHAPLPNPLVRELAALARQAGVPLPLTEEVAADIFTGTFTVKWRAAAAAASRVTAGTLYGNYYDLPPESQWTTTRAPSPVQWGRETTADFAGACTGRAAAASAAGGPVARNGAILEQSQVLTTHNLAALADGLGLTGQLREQAPDLARQALSWMVRRLTQPASTRHAALIQVKNAAYAWRQAIFLLSFCESRQQQSQVRRLREEASAAGISARLGPAIDGLAHVVGGGRFAADGTAPGGGNRFLGWAPAPHWYLQQPAKTRQS